MKILIADDEREIRFLFKAFLSHEFPNSKIDEAANGAEAVDAFRAGNYDVMLMDIVMPVKDGYQACLEIQEISRQEKLKMPFIIICTGFEISKKIKEFTADQTRYLILKKPVDCEQIVDAVKAVMKSSESSTVMASAKPIDFNGPKTGKCLKNVFRGWSGSK